MRDASRRPADQHGWSSKSLQQGQLMTLQQQQATNPLRKGFQEKQRELNLIRGGYLRGGSYTLAILLQTCLKLATLSTLSLDYSWWKLYLYLNPKGAVVSGASLFIHFLEQGIPWKRLNCHQINKTLSLANHNLKLVCPHPQQIGLLSSLSK